MTRDRSSLWSSLNGEFDVLVIGGGATGLGVAVDAATRGYRTAVVEAGDFAQATSSRATKLAHGGVRYLRSGQIHLVREALRERSILLRAAPHLVRRLEFVVPAYRRWELAYYGAGLMLYGLLAGRASLGATRMIGAAETAERVPGLKRTCLKGGVVFYDAQFNDARLALALARTALDYGATAMNYVRCERLIHESGRVRGAVVRDVETGATSTVRARVTINATGIFSDELRKMDDPKAAPMLALSRGTHLVVRAGAVGEAAIIVPKTRDGRVIFAIPWQGRVLIGTTEVAAAAPVKEPGHSEDEIDYLLEQIGPYLERPIERGDILSVFSGLRPLVQGRAAKTSQLSREHHVECSTTGLITITGGKWTTYRRMAEDTVDLAIRRGMLKAARCVTRTLKIHGAAESVAAGPLDEYGSDARELLALIARDSGLAAKIDPALPYIRAQVVYAARSEMARTVEDVLARRTRALLLDAEAAVRCAGAVAAIMARELGRDAAWEAAQVRDFTELARRSYLPG